MSMMRMADAPKPKPASHITAQVYVRPLRFDTTDEGGAAWANEEAWSTSFVPLVCEADETAESVALRALASTLAAPMLLCDVFLADVAGVPLPDPRHSATDTTAAATEAAGAAPAGSLRFSPVPANSTASAWRKSLEAWQQQPDATGTPAFLGRNYKVPSAPTSRLVPLLVTTRPSFEAPPAAVQAAYNALHDFSYQAAGRVVAAQRREQRQHATELAAVRASAVAAREARQKEDERLRVLHCTGIGRAPVPEQHGHPAPTAAA